MNLLKRTFIAVAVSIASLSAVSAQETIVVPHVVTAMGQNHHVQGIAFDAQAGCMYFSFTTTFVKTDLQGNVLGTIKNIQGHLGSMTFDPATRKVYASLEFKDDVIGAGLSAFAKGNSRFYIAIVDVDKVNAMEMEPELDNVLRTVCLEDVVDDYAAKVVLDGNTVDHRYSCSGIDGVTIAPKIGRKGGRKYLYCAYGIYRGDDRSDNDYQVIGRYDLRELDRLASSVRFEVEDRKGVEKPLDKYFVYTGNTSWGVQNLCYDAFTHKMFMAVYKGSKPQFPNYSLFAVDMSRKPVKGILEGVSYDTSRHAQPFLCQDGLKDSGTGVSGWNFGLGSTGMSSLGGGLFYISENGSAGGVQFCKARLFRWTGEPSDPFTEP